jgi:hypothetical protein
MLFSRNLKRRNAMDEIITAHAPETRERFEKLKLKEIRESYAQACPETNPIAFMIVHSVRRTLPYGKWTCKSGREVIFNREYQPILQRINGTLSYADRNEWVPDIVSAEYYYNDCSPPWAIAASKFGEESLPVAERRECEKSLFICMSVLKEFTPAGRASVSSRWSANKF